MSSPARIDHLQQKVILFKLNISRQQKASLKLIKDHQDKNPATATLFDAYNQQLSDDRQQYQLLEQEKSRLAGFANHFHQSAPHVPVNNIALKESTLFAEVNALSKISSTWSHLTNKITDQLAPHSAPSLTGK